MSLEQLNEFLDKKQIQIYQKEQNKNRTLSLSQQGYQMLCGLKKEKETVYYILQYYKYYKRETLSKKKGEQFFFIY